MLDNTLIENALALCGKTIEFCNETDIHHEIDFENRTYAETREIFSDEKFCYYLLSPEFIEKYKTSVHMAMEKPNWVCYIIGEAIYEYQSCNEKPLIELLSKIGN